MAEITHLPEVRCAVSEGLTERDITVGVKDIDGRGAIHSRPAEHGESR